MDTILIACDHCDEAVTPDKIAQWPEDYGQGRITSTVCESCDERLQP